MSECFIETMWKIWAQIIVLARNNETACSVTLERPMLCAIQADKSWDYDIRLVLLWTAEELRL